MNSEIRNFIQLIKLRKQLSYEKYLIIKASRVIERANSKYETSLF